MRFARALLEGGFDIAVNHLIHDMLHFNQIIWQHISAIRRDGMPRQAGVVYPQGLDELTDGIRPEGR